jgi:hypothetical protein
MILIMLVLILLAYLKRHKDVTPLWGYAQQSCKKGLRLVGFDLTSKFNATKNCCFVGYIQQICLGGLKFIYVGFNLVRTTRRNQES